jgi:hypothetical protein
MESETLHVLLMTESNEDGQWWILQCLEFDIAAQARSFRDAEYELGRMLAARVAVASEFGVKPFEGLPQAPDEFWSRYNAHAARVEVDTEAFKLPIDTPAPWMLPPRYEVRVG